MRTREYSVSVEGFCRAMVTLSVFSAVCFDYATIATATCVADIEIRVCKQDCKICNNISKSNRFELNLEHGQ